MKILVIDDDPAQRAAAEEQLKDHQVTVVGSIVEAEKGCNRNDPFIVNAFQDYDVVLTDLMMPGEEYFYTHTASEDSLVFSKVYPLLPIGLGVAQKCLIANVKVGIVSMGHVQMPWAADIYPIPGKLWVFVKDCPHSTKDNRVKDWNAVLTSILGN